MKVAFFLAYAYTKAPFNINIATKLQSINSRLKK